MSTRRTTLLRAGILCALAALGVAGTARAAPAVGVYTGPADTAEHDAFSAWLGTEATYATDFVDDSQSWTNIADYSDWLIDPWSAWVRARSGRRAVISVPLLNQASAGKLADGAAGAYDGYFRTLAQEIVDDGLGNAIIRLGWEANGDWYPWRASADPTAWRAFFRRVVGVMRSVQPAVADRPAQDFRFDLTYNRGTSGTGVGFATMYPGDDVVDIVGLDVYDTKWMDDTSPPEVRWDEILHQQMGLEDFKAFASAHGKPMSIPEWGLWERDHDDNGGVGDNPYFVDRLADWIAANAASVAYQGYFNHLSGWTGDHRLASYVNAQARFGLPVPGPDTIRPTVALTTPRDGAKLSRVVSVAAAASDSRGVAGVQFRLDGAPLGAEDRYAPFEVSWNTASASNGRHALTAVARDVAGNATTSAGRAVSVRNR
jgi:hypothetical protein